MEVDPTQILSVVPVQPHETNSNPLLIQHTDQAGLQQLFWQKWDSEEQTRLYVPLEETSPGPNCGPSLFITHSKINPLQRA